MRAPAGSEYVIGDHAVSMYDPLVGAAGESTGNGFASSPLAETVPPVVRLGRTGDLRLVSGACRGGKGVRAEKAMDRALTPEEREQFTEHLRPLVEEGKGVWRMAHADLRAVKP